MPCFLNTKKPPEVEEVVEFEVVEFIIMEVSKRK